MDVDTSSGRWENIQKLLTRGSPLAHPDFEPSDEVLIIINDLYSINYFISQSSQTLQFMRDVCKILVIGAGGLGCELLKDLVN